MPSTISSQSAFSLFFPRILCSALALAYPLAYARTNEPQDKPVTESTLAPVTVRASSDPRTEKSGSLTTSNVSVFKGTSSVRSIPQPVTVLTREFLDERMLPDLQEVMQNTPGIAVDYVDSERVTYYSRGHAIDSLQVDGLNFSFSGSAFAQPDTATLDRIEVLRGASGMLRGSGNPSATVNMVRKRPTSKEFEGSLGLTLGSWNRKRAELDLSSPLNEAGSLRGRLVLVGDKKDFFQDIKQEDRKVFYGVLQADLTPSTTATLSFQHTDLQASGSWGNIPRNFDGSSLNLPRNLYLGTPWNAWDRNNQQTMAEIEHHFDNGWNLKLSGAYTQFRLDDFTQSYFTRSSTTNPYQFTVTQSVYEGAKNDQYALGAVADGPFSLFGRRHKLVFGIDSLRNKAYDSYGQGSKNPLVVDDIRNWNPYSYPAPDFVVSGSSKPVDTRQQGVFSTARFSVTDPLTVMLGGRLSWYEVNSSVNPANSYKPSRQFTPYAGAIYDLSDQLSVYASYTEIFAPQNNKGVDGGILKPVTGKDFEAGIKGEFLSGKLNGSLAVFRVNNEGKAVEAAISPEGCLDPTASCYIADGKTRSQGFEMDLSGEILPGWQVIAGYTNTSTKYLRDSNAANVGLPLRSIDPRHTLRLFSSYRMGGALKGLTVGGGMNAYSSGYARTGAVTATQGGYAVYNAMLGYKINDAYSLQLNINNLFDKVYFKKYAATGISNYYGDPRNVMLTFRAKF